jgi:two-component system, LuxR family, sensor kinase FixL
VTESRLRAVVETAIDGIIFMDAEGLVTMFNPACERMFGYRADEIIGGEVKRLMPGAEHDQYLHKSRRIGRRKIIEVGREVAGRRKNGDTFPVDLSVAEAEQDGEAYFVGILRDASERTRAKALSERLIEQLTASNLERSYFGHVASHDLREPLRMVAAFCGLLSTDYGDRLDERGREYLSLAVSAAAQMQDLLDDLVEFGRLGLDAERGAWFESDVVLGQVFENLHESIRESGAEITNAGLPRIFGNAIRFNRLMQNLIGNALKYVAPDTVPRIHLSAVQEGPFWRFSVSDNGIGIDARHYDRIFEPFKRLHAKSHYYGTGLGLSICRKIVDGFGGRLWVTSDLGVGSIFSFTVKIQGEKSRNAQLDH